jgi:hypothetical protein
MNVAVVGEDPALVAWAARIPVCGGCVSAMLVDSSWVSQLLSLAPLAHRTSDGRELATMENLSAVLVGGASPETAAAAVALAKTLPLLVLPQSRQGGTEIALLDMHASTDRPLMPAFLHRFDPVVTALARGIEQGRVGDVRIVRMERVLAPPPDAAGRVPHPLTSEAFFLDVDLLRLMGGEFQRVTALRLDTAGESSRQTTVALASDEGPEAVWSVTAGTQAAWTLTVEGSRGTSVIEQRGEDPPRLTINGVSVSVDREPAIDSCLRTFFSRCREGRSAPLSADAVVPTWADCTRAFALTAALEESVRRRRTVVPRLTGNSERDQFKSQMTAIGCGVLCWGVVWVCVGLLLGQVLDPRDSVERRAAAAGTILWQEDYLDAQTLTDSARARLRERLAQEGSDAIVLIESTPFIESPPFASSETEGPAEARKGAVQRVWEDLGREGRPPQVEVRALAGRGFRKMMLLVWGIAFVPLVIFLIAQVFLLTARG